MRSFYELSLIAEDCVYTEGLQELASAIWSKFGQMIPGNTPQEKAEVSLDTVNTALDMAGIADPSGIADGVNTVIYALRAASAKSPDYRNRHLFDALISLVSIIPFADFVKLLKARKLRGGAKMMAKIGRPLKTAASTMRQNRLDTNRGQLMQQWGQSLMGGQQQQPMQPAAQPMF